ncbi:tRNA pseudouridine(55) synthase TruB [Betaproteobacteria bacterium GR16-43]|nr:tRNA pseudouridine(55) synthase TruB [Betaproteobacteria bacterium GR16-43]
MGGVLLLDKPEGWTSTQALGRAKRLLGLRKGGHTGTLDPFATGLLPLVFGEATKFSRFLIDAPKEYLATLCLGQTSTTGDTEGAISDAVPVLATSEQIDDVLRGFVGVQFQVPPMHSALHHQGKRLYELAREGVEVERTPREIFIHSIERADKSGENLIISVKCSKGTYIRTLAQDIGARLGCGAYLTGLRRTAVAGFRLEQAITVEGLAEAGARSRECLLSPEVLVRDLPARHLDEPEADAIEHGRAITLPEPVCGDVALFGPGGRFLGVGLGTADGAMSPARLLANG